MNRLHGAIDRALRSGSSIAVAMAVMSIATYGFTMIAARMLGPGAYGALVAMMNTLLVVSVLQLGLQATAARRIAAAPDHVAQIEHGILRLSWRASLVLGALMLALAPVVDAVLRLDSLPTAVIMGLTAVPMTLLGGQLGILQGERRWYPLAVVYMANGLPRLLIGVALMAWRPDELTAIVGVALGQVVPVACGWWTLRHTRSPGADLGEHGAGAVLRETLHNSQALLAFFALSNLDILIARNVLDDHAAGLYAGGLILTKAVLFLPQFVVVVAFPQMSTASERRRALTRSLLAVAALGAVAVLGALLLPGLAMVFVGGGEYAAIEPRLWMFAVLGTLLSMLQLLVYAVIARQGRYSVLLVWAALVGMVALGLTTGSLGGLLAVVIGADTALLVALLGLSYWLVEQPAPVVADEPVPAAA
ncbi:lipopolysaccharide biosynthesis protein [Nocardioides jiangxiensis]|uniref:Polysaccharide biosynthesis protein n=1 Tax=Nocardioides jiangxiensis TaxID=3064524 RepID=A0ABT9B3H9_9ACTN|nr:polysaccharide biosynthesis protein [Nocardioides sp. WY-20]MDO7869404.1 polysaccharide biosynthesis protein [Nocardioides sp. WY-20]